MYKTKIIEKVLYNGIKMSKHETRYILPIPELNNVYAEALTEISVCTTDQGDTFLMTKWRDYRHNDLKGEIELYDDICAGWVEYDDISPSELDVLFSVEFK